MSTLTYPTLPWKNYNNNVGKFLDPYYYNELKSEHPGADINGNRGSNTDWRDPVYSISKGVVVAAKWYPVWGYIVMIHHANLGVWTVSAHLDKMMVRVGDSVEKGTQIGTIGRGANNIYLAHLHFEVRLVGPEVISPDFWPSGKYPNRAQAQAFIKKYYVDPIKFLAKMKADVV